MKKTTGSFPASEADARDGPARTTANLALAFAGTLLLFALLPLSGHFGAETWTVRDADWVDLHKPPPKKPVVEQRLEERQRKSPAPPQLLQSPQRLRLDALETSLEVGPGDLRTALSLTKFELEPSDVGIHLVFQLHELDRVPNVLRRGRLHYPNHLKRRGLEGEVKLLVRIDEQGRLKVLNVLSTSHPDFVSPSVKAAEGSLYEPPMRNGEPVKTQFHLPIRFTLLDE